MYKMKEMSFEDILILAKKVGVNHVSGFGWGVYGKLRSLMQTDKVEYKAEWLNFKRNNASLWNPPDHSISTYADCVEWKYFVKEDYLQIVLWEGDNFSGNKIEHMCKFTLHGAKEHFKDFLKDKLMSKVSSWVENQFEKEEQVRSDKAKQRIFDALLSGSTEV